MSLAIGLPLIFVWIIGFPLYVFYKLFKQSRNEKGEKFNDKNFIIIYGLFIVGLTDDAYYWEIFIVNARKIVFIICGTLLSSINP
jgi:hypothetical protein